MKNPIPAAQATTASAVQYITLKSATAAKLGKHADGGVSYTISCDPSRTALSIAITDNSSGGYFSREHVAFDRIQQLVAELGQSAFPSKLLKNAFAGKSSNNAGFLAAVLHAEGLLARASDEDGKHIMAGD